MPAITLPDNAFFVLGDFRSNSLDSRHDQLGLVPRDRLIGRVDYVYWDGARDAAVFRPVD
jgi:signal peptidase I